VACCASRAAAEETLSAEAPPLLFVPVRGAHAAEGVAPGGGPVVQVAPRPREAGRAAPRDRLTRRARGVGAQVSGAPPLEAGSGADVAAWVRCVALAALAGPEAGPGPVPDETGPAPWHGTGLRPLAPARPPQTGIEVISARPLSGPPPDPAASPGPASGSYPQVHFVGPDDWPAPPPAAPVPPPPEPHDAPPALVVEARAPPPTGPAGARDGG
jgi:hypothetical protein